MYSNNTLFETVNNVFKILSDHIESLVDSSKSLCPDNTAFVSTSHESSFDKFRQDILNKSLFVKTFEKLLVTLVSDECKAEALKTRTLMKRLGLRFHIWKFAKEEKVNESPNPNKETVKEASDIDSCVHELSGEKEITVTREYVKVFLKDEDLLLTIPMTKTFQVTFWDAETPDPELDHLLLSTANACLSFMTVYGLGY